MRSIKTSLSPLAALILAAGMFAGCKKPPADTDADTAPSRTPAPAPAASEKPATPVPRVAVATPVPEPPKKPSNFPINKRTEAEWIVKSICEEIVRFSLFAAHADAPAADADAVLVTAKGNDASGYHYAVDFQLPHQDPVHATVNLPASIWDPQAYVPFTRDVFAKLAIDGSKETAHIDGKPLVTLTNCRAEVIQNENHRISQWLTAHPLDPVAHEQAALLMVVFGMREHYGAFNDHVSYRNRTVSHLAIAAAVNPDRPTGNEGTVAKAFYYESGNSEKEISKLRTRSAAAPELAPWIVVCSMGNSGDYRILANPHAATLAEKLMYFDAKGTDLNADAVWTEFQSEIKDDPIPDWTRIIISLHLSSVGLGHEISPLVFAREFAEEAKIFPELSAPLPSASALTHALNTPPGHVVNRTADGALNVEVIDNGLWAMFLQRRLLTCAESTHAFLNEKWGVRDQALEFKSFMMERFGKLTIFPLMSVGIMDSDWMRSNAPAIITFFNTHPDLVPDYLWGKYSKFLGAGAPPTFSQPEEWHSPGMLPGSTFNLATRDFYFKNVAGMSLSDLERYKAIAPDSYWINHKIYTLRAGDKPNRALFKQLAGAYPDYNITAKLDYAGLVKDDPTEYVAVMREIGKALPNHLVDLSKYLNEHHREKEAVDTYEEAMARNADPVGLSNDSSWIVNYYADHDNLKRAVEIAQFSAQVYSENGLMTMASLLERLKKYNESEQCLLAIKERYNDTGPLIPFYFRQSRENPGSPAAQKFDTFAKPVYPGGTRNVTVDSFSGPPATGVAIRGTNALLTSFGMNLGDVIVAIDGKQVETFQQYDFIRALTLSDEMDLIVYSNGTYKAIHAKAPNRRFGLDFQTYRK